MIDIILEPDVFIQLLSLVVYFAAIGYSMLAVLDIRRSHHSLPIRYIASGLVLLSSSTAILFIISQIPWITEQQWRVMSFAETLSWLMYDWINGLTHLAIVLAVRTFMSWKNKPNCSCDIFSSNVWAKKDLDQDSKIEELSLDIAKLQQRIEKLDD